MTRAERLRLAARGVAVFIVLLAIIDPVVPVAKYDAAVVAVIAAPTATDRAVAARARAQLSSLVQVVDAPFAAADAIVYVGRHMTTGLEASTVPVFSVETPPRGAVRSVWTPGVMQWDSRNPVVGAVEGVPGGNVATALLRNDGIATDQLEVHGSRDSTANVALGILPVAEGVQRLRLELRTRAGEPTVVDFTALARDRQWKVLVYDARVNWGSTFVRRALEQDPRMTVASRTLTSRATSAKSGGAPSQLDSPAVLLPYDAVLVGAPEALTATEVSVLEQFMRGGGGSVVVLLDQSPSAALARLMGTGDGWEHRALGTPVALHVNGAASSTVAASADFLWPKVLPPVAEVLASVTLPAQRSSPARTIPALWSTPVGIGRLLVSGASDHWSFRARSGTQFAQFWQGVVGGAAARALPPIRITMTPSAAGLGDAVKVSIEDRAAMLGLSYPSPDGVGAELAPVGGRRLSRIALRPTARRGVFEGDFRAPAESGAYLVRAFRGTAVDSAPLGVAPDNHGPAGDDMELVRRVAVASGGESLTQGELRSLPKRLARVIRPKAQRAETHPMRSPWWIVPLAILLGFEWWSRRRSGLA